MDSSERGREHLTTRTVTLMYHATGTHLSDPYVVSRSNFVAHLDAIREETAKEAGNANTIVTFYNGVY